MANADSVGQLYLDSFSNGRIGVIRSTTLNTAGNAVITIPILGGGLTNGGGVANSGGVIVRRVTIQNNTGNVSNANVSISATSDGASNIVSGSVTQCLYVNINAIANNGNTVDICVYGDVEAF